MHYTKDYSKSPAPHFDAVEDIKDYLGEAKYAQISPEMALVTDCRQFSFYCMLAGISGLPVRAWYEHFHGQGSWAEPTDDDPSLPMGENGNSRVD
jgi:hypothetical protein